MTSHDLKARVFAAIDRRAAQIIGIGEQIRRNWEMTAGLQRGQDGPAGGQYAAGLGLSPQTASR